MAIIAAADFNTTLVWVQLRGKDEYLNDFLNFNTTLVWVQLTAQECTDYIQTKFQYNTCLGSTK